MTSGQSAKAHRVVLSSSKSVDGGYHSDTGSISENEDEESSLSAMSCYSDSVFEEAYATEEESTKIMHHMDLINRMRLRGEYCDVTLEAFGMKYQAHKCVLAAASDYFKAMFTSRMREKDLNYIELKESFGDGFARLMLDYIYTGEVLLHEKNIFAILKLSSYFQISTLTELCQKFLISGLSKANCCESFFLAKAFALERLKEESRRVIHDHFPELEGHDDDLTLLEKVDLSLMLSSDSLGLKSVDSKRTESRVLSNILDWLLHTEFQDSGELLNHIRLPLIPKKDILTLREKLSDIRENFGVGDTDSVERFVKSALEYHEKVYEQPLLQSQQSQLRDDKDVWICVDGVLAPEPVKLPSICQHAKSPTEEQRKNKPRSKIRDPFHNVVVLNGFVYAIGGTRETAAGYSKQVLRYDSRLDSWIEVAPMNEQRGDFFACAIGNFLYVFGGKNKHGALQSCERYNPKTNQWNNISELPDEGLYMAAGVVTDGKVFLCGGFNEYEALGKTMRYDPETDQWETLPTTLFKDRGYHIMLSDSRGYIWAIGGIDNPFSGRNVWEVERFSIEDEIWEYVGQVLAVQPFLSVQRLNAFFDKDGNICVFAVTNIDHSPMLRFNVCENLWERLDQPIDYYEIEFENAV